MAGVAIAGGGALRDLVAIWTPSEVYRGALAYDVVYSAEILLLIVTLGLMTPLVRRAAATA